MVTKTLTQRALSVINQYLDFHFANAHTTIPYYNNKTGMKRAALRTFVGKGSPKDISDELDHIFIKNHFDKNTLKDDELKKILIDSNIGIDCSGFVYYVLNAESEEMGHGSLDKHIHFIKCKGLIAKIRASLRPVENCDVETFANDKNSMKLTIRDLMVGDIITMQSDDEKERDHILVIHQIEYQNSIPYNIHYSHAIAYPEDGIYGTGIKQGTIQIPFPDRSITENIWTENNFTGENNKLFLRAKKANTELRRLRVFIERK